MYNSNVLAHGQGPVIELENGRFVVKSSESLFPKGRVVGELTARPGFRGPGPHQHSEVAELFYVLEGRVEFFVGKETVDLQSGMTIEIPAGTVHNFCNLTDTPARLLVIGDAEELTLYKINN